MNSISMGFLPPHVLAECNNDKVKSKHTTTSNKKPQQEEEEDQKKGSLFVCNTKNDDRFLSSRQFRHLTMNKQVTNDIFQNEEEEEGGRTSMDTILQMLSDGTNNHLNDLSWGTTSGSFFADDEDPSFPTPIDPKSIQVVSSLPLDGDSLKKQSPETLETWHEVLGQLNNRDDVSIESASLCSEVTSLQDIIAHPSHPPVASPTASACWSSMTPPSSFKNSTTMSNKRAITEEPGAYSYDDPRMTSQQTKKRRIVSPLGTAAATEMNANSVIKKDSQGGTLVSPDLAAAATIPSKPHQSNQWRESFEALCEFRKIHGHCNVPPRYNNSNSLWRWMKRQRYQYKLKMEGRKPKAISDDRIAALKGIGFVWDSQGTLWMGRLQELEDYRNVHGHCNVPSKYPVNEQLSTWVKCQRRQYKLYREGDNSNMTEERITALNNLGFIFDPRVAESKSKEWSYY